MDDKPTLRLSLRGLLMVLPHSETGDVKLTLSLKDLVSYTTRTRACDSTSNSDDYRTRKPSYR